MRGESPAGADPAEMANSTATKLAYAGAAETHAATAEMADPAATELARSRALRMPYYRTLSTIIYWCIGGVVFIVADVTLLVIALRALGPRAA